MNEEKKLTDEEIVQILEECLFGDTRKCFECKLYNGQGLASCMKNVARPTLDLIHRLQDENKRLKDEKQEIRLFNLALQNGEVDMRIESEMAKSFYNSIIQVFEQNGAKNFFTTTIDIEGKNGRYAFTIEKVGGKTVAEKLAEQKAEIERLTAEIDQRRAMMSRMDCNYATELQKNAELQKKVENQKTVIVGQAKRIEKEKAENKRLYDEFVRLDDFCATKGCICCVCKNKKTCKECAKCGSLATEKCNDFKIDVSKYTRAIERADKLQKQVEELKERAKLDLECEKKWGKLMKEQAVKDKAKEIIELIKRNGTLGYGGYVIHDSTIEQICKNAGVEVE